MHDNNEWLPRHKAHSWLEPTFQVNIQNVRYKNKCFQNFMYLPGVESPLTMILIIYKYKFKKSLLYNGMWFKAT